MNQHFVRNNNVQVIPSRAYGHIDHIEFNSQSKREALISFDLVDADWLQQAGLNDKRFNIDDPVEVERGWKNFVPRAGVLSLFDATPLYRLEVEFDLKFGIYGLNVDLGRVSSDFDEFVAGLEGYWFEFDGFKLTDISGEGFIYSSLFGTPTSVNFNGRVATDIHSKSLSSIFSINTLDTLDEVGVGGMINSSKADLLAVYDVGQGNANALIDEKNYFPTLYYDLGAGAYRNSRTAPSKLCFCFSGKPLIVLSHWDTDHWAGAFFPDIKGNYPALEKTWIAPRQKVGPTHVVFACDVISSGGKFYIYVPKTGLIGVTKISRDRRILFTCGDGKSRNASGIVLVIEDDKNEISPRCWMLTGDCDYEYFISRMESSNPVGLVVPHHGADVRDKKFVPKPIVDISGYRRIVYSFGKDNEHGPSKPPTQHPTSSGVIYHEAAGWRHGKWLCGTAVRFMPSSDTDARATNEHSPGERRWGVMVGWNSPPPSAMAPCGGIFCTTTPTAT